MKTKEDENIERNIHRTTFQRIGHTICLILPILSSLLGYIVSTPIWNLLKETPVPEVFKFIITLIFFIIPTVPIFALTRNTNSIIKIRIFEKKIKGLSKKNGQP